VLLFSLIRKSDRRGDVLTVCSPWRAFRFAFYSWSRGLSRNAIGLASAYFRSISFSGK
jgi:hypothetical protein